MFTFVLLTAFVFVGFYEMQYLLFVDDNHPVHLVYIIIWSEMLFSFHAAIPAHVLIRQHGTVLWNWLVVVVTCLFDYVFRGQQISHCKLNVSAAAPEIGLSLRSKISGVIIVKSGENFGLVPDFKLTT